MDHSINDAIVYGLYSTRDKKIRYIGQTLNSAAGRLYQHINSAKSGSSSPVGEWIRREIAAGFSVRAQELILAARVDAGEVALIAALRDQGAEILNVRAGGGGCLQRLAKPCPSEVRAKMARRREGSSQPREVRDKISASLRRSMWRRSVIHGEGFCRWGAPIATEKKR